VQLDMPMAYMLPNCMHTCMRTHEYQIKSRTSLLRLQCNQGCNPIAGCCMHTVEAEFYALNKHSPRYTARQNDTSQQARLAAKALSAPVLQPLSTPTA
jgi:hypothetical protein